MKAWILQHTTDTPPGSTVEWLEKNNIPYQITRFFEPNPHIPELNDFDLLIICGGAMNVDEEEKYAWMRPEKKLIKDALFADKKVVGLCLGGQLIADVLGAEVKKYPEWEVGWFPIKLENLANFKMPIPTKPLMAFQFHGYSFQIPKDATPFASNDICKNQGFIWKKKAIGMQFHPESTKDWVIQCSEEDLPKGKFVQTKGQMQEGNQYQADLQTWYFQLLNALVD